MNNIWGMKRIPLNKTTSIFIHFIVWSFILLLPLLFMERFGEKITFETYLYHSFLSIECFIMFYLNYCILIPKLLFKKKTTFFLLFNILLILSLTSSLEYLKVNGYFTLPEFIYKPKHYIGFSLGKVFRDTIFMISVCGLASAIRINGRWRKTEKEKEQAQKERIEAELNNLRNQINPHFLLNTLNNIYALITFDTNKAQNVIEELSIMLRYLLYENKETYASLKKEVNFISNYIKLMRIRIPSNVDISFNCEVDENTKSKVAPYIFISLIENAFKHGINPTKKSFIHISLIDNYEKKTITLDIENSNYPKTTTDRSGSGIGLQQVKKRLNLLYPNTHSWKYGAKDGIYKSTIILNQQE